MINLIEIAETIETILNGTNPELSPEDLLERPNYQFVVSAGGVHLDNVADKNTGNNVIPVFVESLGGSIKAIPNFQEANYTIPVVIYFPVIYKDDFFKMPQYIADVFVGKIINFGNSKKGVCNISPTQFGEIESIDMKEFATFMNRCYRKAVSVTEMYMTLSFSLYITSSKKYGEENGPIYGNSVKASLSFVYEGVTYTDNDLIFGKTAVSSQINSSTEQIVGKSQIVSLANGSAYSTPLDLIITNKTFYKVLVKALLEREASEIDMVLRLEIPELEIINEQPCFATSEGLNLEKGEAITLALNLGDRKIL